MLGGAGGAADRGEARSKMADPHAAEGSAGIKMDQADSAGGAVPAMARSLALEPPSELGLNP